MNPRRRGWQGCKHRIWGFTAGSLFVLAGLLPALSAKASTPAVGTLPGSFGVTPTGAATYTIPIALPRGSGGLTPSIALVYNSQSGSSAAGWGWTLAGLSAITRCNKTIDDDGVAQAVQLQSTDDYCLDGQRLRVTGGTSGGSATYDTELRSYSLITSYTGSPTGGPSYWTVQTKDDVTYEYGNTPDSEILATGTSTVRAWVLDKVTDANGNYYTITYQNNDTSTGDYWPLQINYSGNGGVAPDHEVKFDFGPLPTGTIPTYFVHGGLVAQTQRLNDVQVIYNGATAFTYYLTYKQDAANGRSQLSQVEECAADGSCFGPTTIGWESAQVGWQGDTYSGISESNDAYIAQSYLIDVDGDGIEDLVVPWVFGDGTHWAVMFGLPGGGFTSPMDTGIAIGGFPYYQYAVPFNYDGSGRTGLLVPDSQSGYEILDPTGSRAAGDIFTTPANNISITGNTPGNTYPYQGFVWPMDYYGRGLDDIAYTPDGINIYVLKNLGPGSGTDRFATPQLVYTLGPETPTTFQYMTASTTEAGQELNFDDSGKSGGLLLNTESGNSVWDALVPGVAPLTQAPASLNPIGSVSFATGYALTTPMPMDATGDGLTDLLTACTSASTAPYPCQKPPVTADAWWIFINTEAGFVGIPANVDFGVGLNIPSPKTFAADYYSDGQQEAFVQQSNGSYLPLRVIYTLGSGFSVSSSAPTVLPCPVDNCESLQIGNISANGLSDLVYWFYNSSASDWELHYNMHATGADLVANITDGLGNISQFQYASIASGAPLYTKGSGAQYPIKDVQSSMQVVSTVTDSDGTGGTYTLNYKYSGAQLDSEGHGFLGFASRSVTDSRSGVTVTDNFNQTFPWIGQIDQETTTQSNGETLAQTSNTYTSSPSSCGGGALCFPYLSVSTTTVNDATSGTLIKTVQTRDTFGDGYGDLTNQSVTTTDNTTGAQFTTTTATGYANDTTNYCIDLPTSVSITKTSPEGTLARSTSSPQDPSACRPASVTLNSGNTPTLTTAYTYDAYGNPATVTVSGTNLPSDHLTITDYNTYQGEYPDSIERCVVLTSATACSRGLTSIETWDPARGVETSMKDPNLHEVQWGYDGFGRKTSESLPSGLALGFAYGACGSTLNGEPLGAPANCAYAVGETSNAQSLPVAATLYDAKGRDIETEKWLLGGATSHVQTTYDSLGRAVAVSKPSLSTTPSYWTNTSYDVLNRPTQITAPANQGDSGNSDVTKIGYNAFTATATLNAPGNPNVASETTTTVTDALGEVASKTDGSGTVSATTTYIYDPFGNLLSTNDADGHATQMKYDALGHKYTMTDPNMGTWSYGVDALGEVLTQTDADGNTITQNYDALGRLTSRIEKNSSGTVTANDTWSWDTAANGKGLLASESDSVSGFLKAYTYDNLSRPSEVDTAVPGTATPYAVNTSYDNFGRVATVTYPASVSPGAPVASAVASPTSAVVGNNIALNGSGSTDPNGLTLSYQWSGPSGVGIANPAAETTTVTSTMPGAYTIQLVVSDQNASSTPTTVNVTFSPPAPGAPGTSPNPSTTGSYTVSWSGVTGASSYELYESTDGTNYNDLGSVSGTSDSLSGKSDGSYYYKVAACENSVCGPLSAASAPESVLLPPAAPTGLNVSPNPSTTGNFTLSWNSAATATSYKVFLSGNGTPVGTPSTTSFNTSEGDGSYSFYVEACNNGGCSGASATVSETVTLPPNTPATPSASPNPSTTGNFTVSWSAPSSTWTSMQFQESPDQSSWTTEATSGISWSASGFGNGTYYFRTIYCYGSACSTSGIGSETVTLPPAAPTNLTALPSPSTNGSYTLSWTAPAGPVTAYNIYNSSGGFINATTGTSASFGGIADGTYGYYVKACNQTACGGASSTVTETVLHVPGVPSSISLSPTSTYTYDSYTLSWGSASGTVSNYEVNGSVSYSSSTFSVSYSKIKAGNYSYYVQACNSSGCGAATTTVTETVTTNPGGGGGCPPKPYQCQVMTKPGSTPAPSSNTSAPPPSGLNLGALISPTVQSTSPIAAARPTWPRTAAALAGEVTSASSVPPFEKGGRGGISDDPGASGNGTASRVLSALTYIRRALNPQLLQPSEMQMQDVANARERAQWPSLLPSAPAEAVTAWNTWNAQWQQAHPKGPDFAPPEYIAYANAKLEPASGSTYRFEVQYNYDSASGALVSVENAQTGFVYWQVASGGAAPVDAFGHLLGWTDGNSVSTVMAYDQATGAPVGISSGIGQSSAVQQLAYTWDGYGNLTERQDANQSSLYEKLTYDDLNRLTQSQVTNSANNGPTLSFNYSATGNIQTRTVAGTSETYNYDPNHPYAVDSVTNVNGGTYSASYDADGNMTSRNGYQIQWTPSNLPSSIASANGSSTFSYDPEHARYYQSATFNSVTTDTIYVDGLFEVVSSSMGTTEYRHNIVADGQVIAVHTIDQNGSASTDYLHYDHLGSVDAISDDQGNVIQAMSFDAFGLRRDATNWDYDLSQNTLATLKNTTDRGYTFQEELDNVELVHMNGRVYDPSVGRFISADPTIPAPLFTQAFNRYSYVYNNPLENVDPSGFGTAGLGWVSCNPVTENCSVASGGGAADCTNELCTPAIVATAPGNPSGQAPASSNNLPSCTASTPAGTPCAIELGKVEVNGQRQPPPPQAPMEGVNSVCILCFFVPALGIVREIAEGAEVAKQALILVRNQVPKTLARVIPGRGPFTELGPAGAKDVFVTDASAIKGMNAKELSEFLDINPSGTYTIIEFPAPTSGIASPILRDNPGFVGFGQTAGGAPEFVIPNGPIPAGATIRVVGGGP